MNSFLALLLTFVIALAWLRLMDFAAHRGWIESRPSRKIIHIGHSNRFSSCAGSCSRARGTTATWPRSCRGLITVRLCWWAEAVIQDEASVKAMSRSGDQREILRGPLYYGIMFVSIDDSLLEGLPIGIVALMMMCGGDGIADVVGRSFQSPKLFHSPAKSVAGSLGVFFGGLVLAALVLWASWRRASSRPVFPAYPAAADGDCGGLDRHRILSQRDVDNVTVTLAAALLGWWLLG